MKVVFECPIQVTQQVFYLNLPPPKKKKDYSWDFELELELKLIQSQIAQKPMLRGEVGARAWRL